MNRFRFPDATGEARGVTRRKVFALRARLWYHSRVGRFGIPTERGERMLEKLGRNLPCWCGSGKKYKTCHMALDERLSEYKYRGYPIPSHKMIKNQTQIAKIRESCKVNVAVLDAVAAAIRPGMTTKEIDEIVSGTTAAMGGVPAPLHYHGYPYSVCTSVNEQVCHGFPSEKVVLREGDIVNVDCSTILDGYFSDSSRMFCIGEVSPEKRKLVAVTKECVELGLAAVKPWGMLSDVARAVYDHASENGYSVVPDIGGHGVGIEFHEDPFVCYVPGRGEDVVLTPGMMFTIEPMVNMGGAAHYTDKENGWEVYTKDGLPSAQWEIMVLVTEDGHEVLSW